MKFSWQKVKDFVVYGVLHADDTPHRIALGVAIGIFVAFTPTLGMQMILVAVIATLLRANKFVGLPLVWISNPLTLVPVYGPGYWLGCAILPRYSMDIQRLHVWAQQLRYSGSWWAKIVQTWNLAVDIAVPLWVGSLIIATVLGVVSYFVARWAVELVRRRLRGRILVLASASPRRLQLLRRAGYHPRVVLPRIDEGYYSRSVTDPVKLAETLARAKAESVAQKYPRAIVLAADTVVATISGEIFGQPADRRDAERILSALSGTTHQVITAVAMICREMDLELAGVEKSTVRMRPLDRQELQDYLDSGQWRGKAGAYGIQDNNDPFVEILDGSFDNVVGLPLRLVSRMLGDAHRRTSQLKHHKNAKSGGGR